MPGLLQHHESRITQLRLDVVRHMSAVLDTIEGYVMLWLFQGYVSFSLVASQHQKVKVYIILFLTRARLEFQVTVGSDCNSSKGGETKHLT